MLCVEHGHMMSEETIRLLAEENIWLSMQPVLNDEDAIPFPEGSFSQRKFIQVTDGTDLVYRMARIHKVKLAWGTDTLFDPELARNQGKQLVKQYKGNQVAGQRHANCCRNAQAEKAEKPAAMRRVLKVANGIHRCEQPKDTGQGDEQE